MAAGSEHRVRTGSRVWLAACAATVVVLGGGLTACSDGGGDGDTPSADSPTTGSSDGSSPGGSSSAGDSPSATTSPTPTPDPADELADSAPGGKWKVTTTDETDTLRSGETKRVKVNHASTWTFHPGACTDTGCPGTIDSSSGKKYTYTWDGSALRLKPLRLTNPKTACVNVDTGEQMDIDESAYSSVELYTYEPFVGSPSKLAGVVHYKVVHERFYGDCSRQGKDLVASVFTLVARSQGS